METGFSGNFLSCLKGVKDPFEAQEGRWYFSRDATGLSHLRWCFEAILGVTAESVQGSQVYLEWIGISGSFGMVA